MKRNVSVLAGIFLAFLYVIDAFGQDISVTIDQITANNQISGYVSGLTIDEYPNYKILVYVHTDQWYIHPYAGQDEGLSWATIGKNGVWSIQTVQREFKADKIAALVVSREYPEPSRLIYIEKIPHVALIVKQLKDTPDFGKL